MKIANPWIVRVLKALGSLALLACLTVFVSAAELTKNYSINAGAAAPALRAFAEQSGRSVIFSSEKVEGIRTNEVKGEMTAPDALDQMLSGTRLVAVPDKSGAFSIRKEVTLEQAEKNVSSRPANSRAADDVQDGVVKLDTFEVFGRKTLNMDKPRSRDDVQPYVVFDSEKISQSGATDLNEFLRTRLPMNTIQVSPGQLEGNNALGSTSLINLRGLGTNQTLVLVDGRRISGLYTGIGTDILQADVNGIPLNMIERIEILPTTASGIYGGGATGGVVNIILKKKFVGVEVTVTYGNTFNSDVATREVQLTAGLALAGGRTHVTFSASRSDANFLAVADRDFTTRARALMLANNPTAINTAALLPSGYTPNIRSSNGSNLVLKTGVALNSPITFVPGGYAGSQTDGGAALVANAGKLNLQVPAGPAGGATSIYKLPSRSTVTMMLRSSLTRKLEAYVDLSWTKNEATSFGASAPTPVSLQVNSPNNPFTTPITVAYPSVGLPPAGGISETERRQASAGLIVRLPRDWTGALDYTWGRSRFFSAADAALVASNIIRADLASGTINLLRDINAFPIDYAAYLLPQPSSVIGPFVLTQDDVSARISGPVISLTGGDITLSASVEHNKQRAAQGFGATRSTLTGVETVTFYAPRSQVADSAYLEAKIPLVSSANPLKWVEEFSVQGSVRRDEYRTAARSPFAAAVTSRTGPFPSLTVSENRVQDSSYTAGFRFSPKKDVTLRASLGTGFLPPALSQIVPGATGNAAAGLVDPKRGNVSQVIMYQRTQGGNPDLKPEESRSWSVGLIVTPRIMPSLRVSIDYTNIEKRNEIGSISINEAVAFEDLLPGMVQRAALTAGDSAQGFTGGVITAYDQSLINLTRKYVEAFDMQIDYEWKTARAGSFSFNGVGTYQTHLKRQSATVLPLTEFAAYSDGPLKWRVNAGLTWTQGPWTIGWNAQYYDSYYVYSALSSATANAALILSQGSSKIPRQVYHDLFARYRFRRSSDGNARYLSGTEISAGIQNLFNESPPILASSTALAQTAYSNYGDPRLSRYTVSLRKSF